MLSKINAQAIGVSFIRSASISDFHHPRSWFSKWQLLIDLNLFSPDERLCDYIPRLRQLWCATRENREVHAMAMVSVFPKLVLPTC